MRNQTGNVALAFCMAMAKTRRRCPCTAQSSSTLDPKRYHRSLLSACNRTVSRLMRGIASS